LNISRLKRSNIKQTFENDLERQLDSLQPDMQNVESSLANFRDLVYITAAESLGPTTCKHQDWFDEKCVNIQAKLRKTSPRRLHINDPKASSPRRCNASFVLSRKAEMIQSHADRHNMNNFYSVIKEIY